jgi:predicted secreted protein
MPLDTGSMEASDIATGRSDVSSGPAPEPPSGDVPEGWTVEWVADGDGWSITGNGSTAELTAPDRYGTTATVTVTVSTPKGRSASADTTITTGSNTAPAIVNSTARPNPVAPGDTIEATIEASDPNGDELSYQWRVADPWEIEETSGGEATIRAPDRDGVFVELRVEVRDGYGGTSSTSLRLETRTNTTPSLASVTASPPQVAPGGTIQLEAEATDSEDDELGYEWSIPQNWNASSLRGATIEVTAPDAYDARGKARVVVEDTRGATTRGNVVISTRENRGPEIASFNANPSSVQRGGTIEFEIVARDPDGDPLSYDWSVQKSQSWTLENVNGSRAELTSPNQPNARTRVRVTVEDREGKTAEATTIVSTKANAAPSVASISANPQTISPGQTSTLSVSASDPDGDSLDYQWSVTGNWSVSGSGASATVTAPSDYGTTGVITVKVTDGFGGSATGTTTLSTRDNGAPIIGSLSPNPPTVAPEGTTRVVVDARDPNGDPLNYNWSLPSGWTRKSGSNPAPNELVLQAPNAYGQQQPVGVTVDDGQGGSAQASTVVSTEANLDPSVASLSANPQTISPGQTSSITVTASDPNGDSLSYQWSATGSWSVSGSGASATVTAPSDYGQTGVVTVKVTDGAGGSATGTITLSTRDNGAPAISSLSANPPTVTPRGTTRLVVNASDPNGDKLSYNWSIPKGWKKSSSSGSGGGPKPNELVLRAPDTYDDKKSVEVTVTDGQGGSAKASVFVSTTGNGAPSIASLTASPSQIAPQGTTTLTASASDPNGDSLSYSWTLPGNNWSKSGSGSSIQVTAPNQFGLQKTVRLEVTDGQGGTARASVAISTSDNQLPTISSLTANPQTVAPGKTTTLTAQASDPDGQSLSYSWTLPNNWTQSGQGKSVQLTAPNQFGTSGTVRVTVSDGTGGTATSSVVVYTRDNRSPVVSSVTASPQPASPGAKVQVEALASDPDGRTLSYTWQVPSGWSKSGSGQKITLTAPSSYGQSGVVRVTVSDGSGGSAQGSTLVATSQNQSPVLSALTANPQSVKPNGTVQVKATASDPNGDSLNYNWTLPQGWSKSGSGAQITVTAPGSYNESGLVQLTVDDGNGGTDTGSVLVRTDNNQSPVISNVTAQPVVLAPGGKTTIQVQASDPNGDSLSYSWNTPNNWTQQGSGQTIQVVAPNKTNASATVTVTVADGRGGRSKSAVVIQTVNNRAPSINSLSASPSKVKPKGTITITSNVSDPEGDSIQYNWNVPSGWSKSGSGSKITVTAPNDYGRTDTVTLTASDGRAQSSDQVLVQTEANQPPTISKLNANPNPVLQNSGTTVTATASDPYGDSLSYSWSIDNNNWTLSGSGSSVDLDAPNNGNSSVKVTVTVDDGNGATASSSITVKTKSCASGTGNCDGKAGNGCEVNLDTDSNNCGACGNQCPNNKPYCKSGSCKQLFTFRGVKKDLPKSNLEGWSRCYKSNYDGSTAISQVLNNCDGSQLLMACGRRGSNQLELAAHAPRQDVTYDVGNGNCNTGHDANGVRWYRQDSGCGCGGGWGFAPGGAQINLNCCDYQNSNYNDERMCIHNNLNGNGNLNSGYRCGDNDLNGDSGWVRIIYESN